MAGVDIEQVHQHFAELLASVRSNQDELRRLGSILRGPSVPVLAHFWRHHSQESVQCKDFADAVSFLWFALDNGEAAPIGVSVNGGEPIPWEQAWQRWGPELPMWRE